MARERMRRKILSWATGRPFERRMRKRKRRKNVGGKGVKTTFF